MSDISDVEHQRLVSRFWHNYLSLLEKLSIPVKARPWYRKHVEEYISAHQGVKLQQHLPHHIDEYLSAKGRIATLPEWRFRQIADALRLLFKEFVRPAWADEYDWYQWRAFSRELESDHPTLMRFREEHATLHQAFVKTIRVRGMAVQTKTRSERLFLILEFYF